MIVPVEMSQFPPVSHCLVRLPLNGADEQFFTFPVGAIFFGKIVFRLRGALPTQIEYPGRGKVHQQIVKQGECFLVDGILLTPPFSKKINEELQAFVFDDEMPQRRHIPAPAVRPVTPTDQGLETVEVLAFALPLKARQKCPQNPGGLVVFNFCNRLVEFKRMDMTVKADSYQTAFIQVRQDVPHTFRQRRHGRLIGMIRFQISQVVRRGMSLNRQQKHGILQCEVLRRRNVMFARISGFDNLPFHFIRLTTFSFGLFPVGFTRAPVTMPVPAPGTTGCIVMVGIGRSRRPLADQVRFLAVGTEQVFMNDRRKQWTRPRGLALMLNASIREVSVSPPL